MILEPVLSLDGRSAAFGRISSVVSDDTGSVYVADEMADEILVFDPSGRVVRTVGARGNGPGEFQSLTALGRHGDTLVALDFGQRRLTLFDAEGRVAGTIPWPDDAGRPRDLLVSAARTYTMGTIRRSPSRAFSSAAEAEAAFRQPQVRYGVLSGSAAIRPIAAVEDTLTEPRGFDCDSRDGSIVSFEPLFGSAGPLRAITPAGELVLARNDRYRLDFVDLQSGDTVRTLDRDLPRRPVSKSDWDHATRPFREMSREVPLTCGIESRRPEFLPVIRSITADNAGSVWIEAYGPDGFLLAAVDSAGRLIGEAPLPDRDPNVPLHIRDGKIYLVERDPLGVQSVVVLRASLEE